ncbi:MAG TPA: VCBS repeat-containing protein [Roseiflexaceae bacterium]|nr:VCBS repeat-containing protein [Roseiflexaceae bacterium]
MNNDGSLEIILGNYQEKSYIYTQSPTTTFDTPIDLQGSGGTTSSVALGDINNDHILDVVLGNKFYPSQIFIGLGNGLFLPAIDIEGSGRDTRDVDLADLNKDGRLDIVLTNFSIGIQIYTSKTDGGFEDPHEIPVYYDEFVSSTLGDVNNDGFIDMLVATETESSSIYINSGKNLYKYPSHTIDDWGSNRKIALGDIDADGNLDAFTADRHIYRGNGNGTFTRLGTVTTPNHRFRDTSNTLLGDIDSDGKLDVFLANYSRFTDPLPSQMHRGNGDGSFGMSIDLFPEHSRETKDGALGDLNNDGRLDIALVNRNAPAQVAFQTNTGFSSPIDLSNRPAPSTGVALGDLDGNGRLDIVIANADQPSQIILNRPPRSHWPVRHSVDIQVQRPGPTPEAAFFSTPVIHDQPVISIPYKLTGPADYPARRVLGLYSLDGGGSWKTAVPTNTQTTDLAVSPQGVQYVFHWDTFASGVFGHSDNVVVRLLVLPSIRVQPNQAAPLFKYASAAATTLPFRVRGTQVRTIYQSGWPAVGARVYRLGANQNDLASQFPSQISGLPEKDTGTGGYLEGRSPLAPGDQLMALIPISATDTYTMYWSSARVTPEGLKLTPVRTTGVQTLTMLSEQPLILFNLDISLEWDARNDSEFQSMLKGYIQRASALLFRWSGGQAALGDTRIFNNRERWSDAHIRLYATNRMRPNAAQGGISSETRADPQHPHISYTPGQIRIGAVWNRYGDTTAQLGDDWASTLAHELGHYALYLDDNYLGLDAQSRLISVTGCPGPMTDPYLENYGSFHPSTGWLPACAQTLSHQETGRSDWATIKAFYQYPKFYPYLPFLLNEPEHFNPALNPKALPVEFTRLWFHRGFAPSPAALGTLIVKLIDDQHRSLLAGPGATGFLFQDDRLIDLGATSLDQLQVRGVNSNNRVCVFELEQQRLGCQRLTANFQQLKLSTRSDWQPDLVLTPVTSTTMRLDITGLQAGLKLRARLYPSGDSGLPPVALSQIAATTSAGASVTYTALLGAPGTPVFEGYIHLFVEETAPQRELVMDFRTSGNPGLRWNRRTPRGNPGLRWNRRAPVLSSDGQAILYGPDQDLLEGQFYMLQRTLNPPPPPDWAQPIGRAYRLTTTPGLIISGRSLNIGYLATDVSVQQERGIQLLFWDAERAKWEILPTRLDTDRNEASASISKPGIYMLMTSTLLPLNGPDWNLLDPYLGATQPITIATAPITGKFSTVYGYNRANPADAWQLFDPAVPTAWQPAVSNLDTLTYNQSYWLYATETVTWTVRQGGTTIATQAMASVAPDAHHSDVRTRATSAPPPPPATFYGFAPAAGLSVEAYVDGLLCGTAVSRWFGEPGSERPIFVVRARATGDGPGTGCGSLGRSVTVVFKEGSRTVEQRSAAWDNTRALFLEPRLVYLPLVRR